MSKRMVDLKVEGGKIASIDDYEVGGGTTVEANPQDEATTQLNKIKIDNVAYNIAGGSGGIVVDLTSGIITDGSTTTEKWLSQKKLLPNTAYEIGDNFQLHYEKRFNPVQLQANETISILDTYAYSSANDRKLQYGDVIMVPTLIEIKSSSSMSGDRQFRLYGNYYITYTVIKAGTTGDNVNPPSETFDEGAKYLKYTFVSA